MTQPSLAVAIVDDDESVGRALKRMLRSLPVEVYVFTRATKFLETFANRDPALLILDLQMPEMDGLELQQALRKQNRTFPIVFITARDDDDFKQRAIATGAMDFLTKPFEKAVVLSLVSKALSLAEERRPRLRLVGRFADGFKRLIRPHIAEEGYDFEQGDLLPCPFCGAYPRVDKGTHVDMRGREHHYARVVCPRCGAMVATERDEKFPSAIAAASEITRRWNLRNRST
ncbi:MAG: response regulator [Verrucomicrobiae bacterium]|nr:response regulator [Verrucomicrobiae bacterium]